MSPLQIIEINELYYKYKNYAKVGRELGLTGPQVKRHIVENYVPQDQLELKKFEYEDLPEPYVEHFKDFEDWGELCELTSYERQEVEELWKEISI